MCSPRVSGARSPSPAPTSSTPCLPRPCVRSPRQRAGSIVILWSRSSSCPARDDRSPPARTSQRSTHRLRALRDDNADLGRLMADAVEAMNAITVARIQGHCIGEASYSPPRATSGSWPTDVYFSIPEVDLGIPLAWGGIPRLVREIGPALTKELVMTCRPFTSAEALAAGFLEPGRARGRSRPGGRRPRFPAADEVPVDVRAPSATSMQSRARWWVSIAAGLTPTAWWRHFAIPNRVRVRRRISIG